MKFYELNNKRIFITGGTGYVGKTLIKYLIDNNLTPEQICILTRNSQKHQYEFPELQRPWIFYKEGNILDLSWDGQEYDFFIHGATGVVEQSEADMLFEEILIGTRKAIEFANKAKVKCFLNLSSGGVYAQNTIIEGLLETSLLVNSLENKKSTYGIAKYTAEHLLFLMAIKYNIKVITLRGFCFAGSYLDKRHFAIGEFVINAINNKPIKVLAGRGVYRSYLAGEDLARCIYHLLLIANTKNELYNVYNIGSEEAINLPDLARKVVAVLDSKSEVIVSNEDTLQINYYVPNVSKLNKLINVQQISLDEVIRTTSKYYTNEKRSFVTTDALANMGNKNRNSITAVVACYNDEQAIPIMAERLVTVFVKCNIDYEIIFISNGSTDGFTNIIQELSKSNERIIGVTHSRSFEQTSQASFLNGMELSTKQSCVLLDGDLQDPPELIEQFVEKWKDGYDIVYGVRYQREAPWFVQFGSKIFYRIFDKLSTVGMPHDAGDFSLIDRRAVNWMLKMGEHDVLIRGMRAYVGFKHTGIKYYRPERMFGKSSNNFFKLIMWLKKGIFAYSRKPLDWMTTFGFSSVVVTLILAFVQILLRLFAPSLTPKGLSTIILLIMFFGSFTILSISVVGEYIAKIVEETKKRPIFIRDKIIRNGNIEEL